MYYSSFGILAVIHHIIINHNILKNAKNEPSSGPRYRYRQFLNSILVFYITDLLWGFFEEAKIRVLVYADTVVFFATMALSILLWARYVVAYIDKKGIKSKSLLGAGWGIFIFVISHLIINFFNPTIFTVTEEVEYVPETGRYFLLAAQFFMFVLITVYSFFVSIRSQGRDKVHYKAVCLSGGVMAVFIVLQSFDAFAPFYTIGCFIANCIIHVFVEEDEKQEQEQIAEDARKGRERYTQIAAGLANDYEAIYYINIETGKYMEVSVSEAYEAMNVPMEGEDFYEETRENARRYAHPDDREFAVSMYYKETMLKNLEGRKSYSYRYRIMVGDEARYYRFVVMLSEDGKHFVLCDKDIHDTITAETALLEKQKAHVTFSQIAESLASNYDVIYYVDIVSGEYMGYTSHNIYGELKIAQSGDDFFGSAVKNLAGIIHPQDKERMMTALDKDHMITALEGRKQHNVEYRLIISGKVQNTRLSIRKSSDGVHFIIGVENIDEEVRKRNEHIRALNTEKELARRDELTGTRNKTAFTELEQSVQADIEGNTDLPHFALVVCDLNDLKKINDTEGHKAGDEYIRSSAKLLCDIFAHSPVFRIGGDEFAVFLSGSDLDLSKQLMNKLRSEVLANLDKHEGPVIAAGMAEFKPGDDLDVTDVFDRADQLMYEDKRKLKKHK